MTNIRIESDGTAGRTKITLEDGTPIVGVFGCHIEIWAGEINRAELKVYPQAVAVLAKLTDVEIHDYRELEDESPFPEP